MKPYVATREGHGSGAVTEASRWSGHGTCGVFEMERVVAPERLDALRPEDPLAIASRRDLRRLNTWMGNIGIAVRVLRSVVPSPPPRGLLELGAGDGRFLLQVARKLSTGWRGTRATLLDRQPSIGSETQAAFETSGWQAQFLEMDVGDWARRTVDDVPEVILANLFLHHFQSRQLLAILAKAARSARVFVALEPRRSRVTWWFSRLVGLIGCNEVTRHDASISVRAGFSGKELSASWPTDEPWKISEGRAGPFTHLFVAERGGTRSIQKA